MSEEAVQALKQEMERELSEAQADHSRYLSDLDAIAVDRRFADRAAAEPAIAVITDRSAPDETRIEAIRRVAPGTSTRGDYVAALLAILRDRNDSADVRNAALQALGSAAFQTVRFAPHHQEYERTLRELIADPVPELRETAVGVLAVERDPEVQQVLLEGLRGNGPLPVERERAIQLLAEDDHLDNLPWLRELYRNGDSGWKQEAVRLMGAYPEAQPMLEQVLRDRGESTQVRQQSAASLRNLAPERFEAVAKEIATDLSEYPEIRTASLNALQHLGEPDRVRADTDFVRRLAEVASDETEPEVTRAARDFIEQRPPR